MREPGGRDPLFTTCTRAASAATIAAADFWRRTAEMAGRYASEVLEPPSNREGRPDFVPSPRHFLGELVAAGGYALQRFGGALAGEPEPEDLPGEIVAVDGRTVVLPLRILDASQGLVMYPVPIAPAQALLDALHGGTLVPADLGRGRAALEIYVVDYRVTDLGRYRELGISLFAAPKGNPSAVGLCTLAEPVTDPFACRAGVDIWGEPKTEERLDFVEREDALECRFVRAGTGARVLDLTLPRGGTGASIRMPLRLYSRVRGALHVSQIRRSGRGDRLRANGRGVKLTLHEGPDGRVDPVVAVLRAFGLPDARPMLCGWTEHMTAVMSGPVPVG